MKLFACFAAVQAKLVDYIHCVHNAESESIDPSRPGPGFVKSYAPESFVGQQSCLGNSCDWMHCPEFYQPLALIPRSGKRMSCKYNKNSDTYSWTKPGLWGCKTCDIFEPLENNPDFKVECRTKQGGNWAMKVCDISCKNGEKIQPINKRLAKNVQCKCNKRTNECNWSKGKSKYDLGDETDFSNWSCPQS